jgi:lipid II:glycine glycyltransferase (peptidoglycan interpeptide bridge formation enzyme)
MGGTLRTEPDLKVGHFTHWQAMKRARELNLLGYDFTSGGSAGVMRFKQGFNPQRITFDGHRHVQLRPMRASLLEYGSSFAARRKARIGTILSGLARLTSRR